MNISSKKLGRPIVGSLKNIDIKVRIDESTNQKLLAYCQEKDITRAEAIRKAIMEMLKK